MRALSVLVLVALGGCSVFRPAATPSAPATPAASAKAKSADVGPKPYAEVVTAAAVSDPGLFTVHRIGGAVLFEIPDSLMGRDLLSVSRIAAVPAGLGAYLPAGTKTAEQVLRWERDGDRVRLRTQSYTSVADAALPIAQSVQVNNFQPVLAAFDVAAVSPDSGAVVIDVTALYTGDVAAFSGLSTAQRTQFKVRKLDADRTFIDDAKAFPENVNVRHTLTYDAAEPPQGDGSGTISMQMYQSFVLLPGGADDRASGGPARGLLLGPPDRLRPRRPEGRRADLHPPLAARADRHGGLPARRAGAAGQAHRLHLGPGHARALAAVLLPGRRGLEPGVRGRPASATPSAASNRRTGRLGGVRPGGRPVLDGPLRGLHHAQRDRARA